MEDQAKLLADLAAAISSMNAKLDDLHPLVLELNQCRPGVGRAVDALRAEVGDLQARVVDTTHPAEPEAGTDMRPLLLLSADAPSSSSKPASASNQISATAATSCIEVCTCAPLLDTNGRVAKVPTPTCSETEQDIPFQITGVTTVALRHNGVPELSAEPTALLCSPSPTNIGKETLDEVLSACTSSITTMPTTCSTFWLPQGPVAALVLVASSPRTMTESIASQHTITKFPVHRPVPWPFFLAVHANGDETRPLPWPSFRISYSRESPRDAVMKPSRRCTSGSSSTSTTFGDAIEFQVSGYHGNLCTSTSCITILDMCSASELRCWNKVLLFLEYWLSTSNCVQLVNQCNSLFAIAGCIMVYYLGNSGEWRRLKDVLLFPGNCGQPALTNHTTLAWPRCTISSFQLLVLISCLDQNFLPNDYTLLTINWDSGAALSHGSVSWLFSTLDGHLLDLLTVLLDNGAALSREYWMANIFDCVGSSLIAELVASKLLGMFRRFEHWWNYMQQAWPSWRSDVLMERNTIAEKNPYLLLLPWVFRQEELNLGFQFQLSSILPDWYFGNQSAMARLRRYYFVNYNWLADTGRTRFLCMSLVGAAVHVFVWPVGKQCENRQSAQSVINQGVMLVLVQDAALKYTNVCWSTTAILTEVFMVWFPMQMCATCSAQLNLQLALAYRLTCDPSEESGCHVPISLNLHISLARSRWTLCNEQVWELAMDIYLMGLTREENSVTWLVVRGRFNTLNWTHLSAPHDPELYDPWDPGGHTPREFNDGGLRASRMLRGGECHEPCGPPYLVAWAVVRRGLQAQDTNGDRCKEAVLKVDQGRPEATSKN